MKEKLVNISFLAAGHIVQDIVLSPDSPYTAEQLVGMLNNNEAFTTVHEDNVVILPDGTPIGTVRYSDTELEYDDFQVETGDYELDTNPVTFGASRLARSFAIGEFISDTDDLSVDEIITILQTAGVNQPVGLSLEEGSMDKTGIELLREIELMEYGLKNIMTIAHDAGKKGQEII